MAKTRFVCLANSFKEGGRCLAGIQLDENNQPVIVNDKPKWIRPVCNTPHGEVPNEIAEGFHILDIIEIDIIEIVNKNNFQSENVTFRKNSIKKVDDFNIENLEELCDTRNLIFGNRGKAIHIDEITHQRYSLILIEVTDFQVIQKVYEDNPKPKTRLTFTFNDIPYDLPITDPVFLHEYQENPNFWQAYEKIYVSLSIGVEWEGWYYKLIAGIIHE